MWFSVSDTGCGMDQGTLSHLFEPFFTTKEVGKGIGLGLATVEGAVAQNAGFIGVRSDPHQGTTFEVFLPRHVDRIEPALLPEPARQVPRGEETVLLVEDEEDFLAVAKRMLEQRGYTVLAVGTPGKALRLARQHAGDIHLLLTDVVMPEMSGQVLATNLRSLYPNLKHLFMSGYPADVVAQYGLLAEDVSFLSKPFSADVLVSKVRAVLDAQQ